MRFKANWIFFILFSMKSHKTNNLEARRKVPFCSYFMALSLHGLFQWIAVCPNEAGAASKPNVSVTIASLLLDIWLCSPGAPDWAFVSLRSEGSEVNRILISSHNTMAGKYGQPHDHLRHGWVRNAFLLGFCPKELPWAETSSFPAIASTAESSLGPRCLFFVTSPFNNHTQWTTYPQKYMTWKLRARDCLWRINFANVIC